MKLKSGLGITLLAVYLLIIGVMGAFGITLGALSPLVPILAIVTGIVLLMGK